MPSQYPEHLKMRQAEKSRPSTEATFTNDTNPHPADVQLLAQGQPGHSPVTQQCQQL